MRGTSQVVQCQCPWAIEGDSISDLLTPPTANPRATITQKMIRAQRCAGSGYFVQGFSISPFNLVEGYGRRKFIVDPLETGRLYSSPEEEPYDPVRYESCRSRRVAGREAAGEPVSSGGVERPCEDEVEEKRTVDGILPV